MTTHENPNITLVGGGLGGALLACYLGKRGYDVDLYERRGDIRAARIVRGRSINLALSVRGLKALDGVGLVDEVMAEAIPMRGRMMHSETGELTFQPYGTEETQVINSVSRAGLNRILLAAADRYPNVKMHFEHRCRDIDLDSAVAEFENGSTGERTRVQNDLVFGTDGAFSAVRAQMQRLDRFDYSQTYLPHGYKELVIPPTDDGGFRIEKNALHIWPRRSFMMIALPNADGSFTCTLFWPLDGPFSFSALKTEADVDGFFRRWFADAVPHMPTLVEDYLSGPPSSLVTVRCFPWTHGGRVALLGDACHAVVPFYGQGMNAAFEDCRVLDECIEKHSPEWTKILTTYENARKKNVDTLADLAIANFVEMRDHVASPWFLLKNKLGKLLHRVFPKWYIPLYSLVTFSNVPYFEARERARRQSRIVRYTAWTTLLVILVLLIWVFGRSE